MTYLKISCLTLFLTLSFLAIGQQQQTTIDNYNDVTDMHIITEVIPGTGKVKIDVSFKIQQTGSHKQADNKISNSKSSSNSKQCGILTRIILLDEVVYSKHHCNGHFISKSYLVPLSKFPQMDPKGNYIGWLYCGTMRNGTMQYDGCIVTVEPE